MIKNSIKFYLHVKNGKESLSVFEFSQNIKDFYT